MTVGLCILLCDQTNGRCSPHMKQHMIQTNMFIVRPVIKLSHTMIIEPSTPVVDLESDDSCYLKSCHLCHKKLQPEDDIYMYKGDQGYCTEECRNKQIKMDKAEEEKEERQAYMTNLASRRQHKMMRQQNSGKCNETLSILRDLRQKQSEPVHLQKNGAIFF